MIVSYKRRIKKKQEFLLNDFFYGYKSIFAYDKSVLTKNLMSIERCHILSSNVQIFDFLLLFMLLLAASPSYHKTNLMILCLYDKEGGGGVLCCRCHREKKKSTSRILNWSSFKNYKCACFLLNNFSINHIDTQFNEITRIDILNIL